MTSPHSLPDFLLIPDPCGQWHLRDRTGAFLFEGLGLCLETLLTLAEGTGASFKIVIPIPPYVVDAVAQRGQKDNS